MTPVIPNSPPAVADFLAQQRLALTSREIITVWGRSHLRTALRRGRVTAVLPHVHVATSLRSEPDVVGRALSAWQPHGLVTGQLALHLYAPGRLTGVGDRADIVVATNHHLRSPAWLRVHQTGRPQGSSAPLGIPCTLPERAVLDAWRYAPARDRTNLFYEALWLRVCHWSQVRREAENTVRVPQRGLLYRLLDEFAAGATSPLEVRARREVFQGRAFADFERQAPLRLGKRTIRVDMLHRRARVVVELDGERYHSSADAMAADDGRALALASAGYVVIRFGWKDIVGRPQWVRRQVLAVIAAHDPGARPPSRA